MELFTRLFGGLLIFVALWQNLWVGDIATERGHMA